MAQGTLVKIAIGVAACATLLTSFVGHAAAQAKDSAGVPADDGELGNHQRNIRLDMGVRTQFVSSAGLDPFSERDALPQLSLGGSMAFWARDELSIAAAAGFDYGGSSAKLRSDSADLRFLRLSLAPEARYHVFRILALTAKVGPTLTRESAEVTGGLPTRFKTGWKFGFDATAGAALELWGYANPASKKPRLWLLGEGGYGWTAPMSLVFEPEETGSLPQRLDPLDLGKLSLSGPLFRIALGLSFW